MKKLNKVSELNDSSENEGYTVLTENALISACENGKDTIKKCLLDKGAKIIVFDEDSFSALALASYNGHESTDQLLLNNDADINLCKKSGASPLFMACQDRHDGTVQLLRITVQISSFVKKNRRHAVLSL